jgi:AcrR family transcriptional regulator
MAKPLVPVETIYDTALQLLDQQGAEALSARNLAAALQCSTRTLYQQVGKREELIGRLIEHHLAGLKLEFHREDRWQASAISWANGMRQALLAHPHLAQLMTVEHRAPVAAYVNELLKTLLREGFEEELALRSCRVLANVAISLSLSEVKTPPRRKRARRSPEEIQFEDLVIRRSGGDPDHFQEPPEVFENTIRWLVQGMDAELAATAGH